MNPCPSTGTGHEPCNDHQQRLGMNPNVRQLRPGMNIRFISYRRAWTTEFSSWGWAWTPCPVLALWRALQRRTLSIMVVYLYSYQLNFFFLLQVRGHKVRSLKAASKMSTYWTRSWWPLWPKPVLNFPLENGGHLLMEANLKSRTKKELCPAELSKNVTKIWIHYIYLLPDLL